MAFWLFFFGIILAIIAGAFLVFLLYMGYNFFFDRFKIKKKLPKEKEKVTEWVESNREFFAVPIKTDKTEKEVEDDTRNFERIREFERLRRDGISKKGIGAKRTNHLESEGDNGFRESRVFSYGPTPEPTRDKRRIRLN